MAIGLLYNGEKDNIHHAQYDLESLMYVALFCATMLKGPNDSWRLDADFKALHSIPMQEWFDLRDLEATYKAMGRRKVSHMALFEDSIISKMDPYFSPLFDGFLALKNAVFPPGAGYFNSPITHDVMIKIFNNILSGLPKEHTAASQMKRGVKRTREFV